MNRFATYSWLITALLLLAGFLCLELKAVGYGAAFFMAFPASHSFLKRVNSREDSLLLQ